MKPEQAETFLIQELFSKSQDKISLNEKFVEVDKLTGDASTRRYYRIYTNKNSYVVCLDHPFEESEEKHPFLSVQQFLDKNGIRVPKVLDSQLDKGYLLEEDLGDKTLLQHLSEITFQKSEFDIYKKIVDQLIVLHKIPKSSVKSEHLFKLKFDYEKYMDETKFTIKYFINIFMKNASIELEMGLLNEFSTICQRLANMPMVITHRDFHSRNIMLRNGEFIFIDFQDARWGIPQYDLVSLLEDCYYDLNEKNRNELIKYYYESLGPTLGQKSFDEFKSLYRDMLMQRVFKAVGSFCYIYNWRKDERYLKYIGFAMEKIRKTMMDDSRYAKLQELLFKFYYAH